MSVAIKSFNPVSSKGLQVTVKTRDQIIYPKIGKDDRAESTDGEQGGFFASPLMGVSGM